MSSYTAKQGQYLAYIYYYTKIHGEPPAQAEMQGDLYVSPPSVHQMVLTLEKKGLIERTPGAAPSFLDYSIERSEIPDENKYRGGVFNRLKSLAYGTRVS